MKTLHMSLMVLTLSMISTFGCGDEDAQQTPQFGTIQGTVIRAVAEASEGSSPGTLYISVFETDPIQGRSIDNPPVANLVVEDVVLSAMGSEVSFELNDIPTRAEPYVMTAVFDTNQNLEQVDPPGPDDGDLVALEGIKSPKVVVNQSTVVTEIELNFECADGICDPLN